MRLDFVSAAAAGAFFLAEAVYTSSLTSCTPKLDLFDNVTPPAVPQLQSLGPYNGLNYQAFAAAGGNLVNKFISGINPQSDGQAIVTGMLQALVQIGRVTLFAAGNILADPAQGTKSFNLNYFYFGCGTMAPTSGTPGLSIACTVTVIGYNINNVLLPVQTFGFAQDGQLGANMVKADLQGKYTNMKNVTIGVSNALPARTVLVVDNVDHCNNAL